MNKPLYLFVGKSGSGKSTIAEMLEEQYHHKQVWSYTTRPMRYENEKYHTFISDEQFDALENIVAYTEYNNYKYGTTVEQLDQCSVYVVDIPGVQTLLERYKSNRPIVVMYFDTTIPTRIHRMIDRGDCDAAIIARLLQDEEYDWHHKLNSLVWHYSNLMDRNVCLHVVDANNKKECVLKAVLEHVEEVL